MRPSDEEITTDHESERRIDGPVETVDEGVVLASIEGVGPAMDHMSEAGVERKTVLRVLGGPEFHRDVGSGTISRVLQFLRSHWGGRDH
jgi:hypothetical protein